MAMGRKGLDTPPTVVIPTEHPLSPNTNLRRKTTETRGGRRKKRKQLLLLVIPASTIALVYTKHE